MAKGIYLGIDSLSRKVKKMYLGIEGVARKVKKGYVGVNGLARLFFSGVGKPEYLKQFEIEYKELGVGPEVGGAGQNSKYALFWYDEDWSSINLGRRHLLAFEPDLTYQISDFQKNVVENSSGRYVTGNGFSKFEDFAVFPLKSSSNSYTSFYDVFVDPDLLISEHSVSVDWGVYGYESSVAGGAIGGNNLIRRIVGYDRSFLYYWDSDAVSTLLASEYNTVAEPLSAASTDSKVFFIDMHTTDVACYDEDFTKESVRLSRKRGYSGLCSTGNKFVLGGGSEDKGGRQINTDKVTVIDEDLTISEIAPLFQVERETNGITFLDGYFGIGGGYNDSTGYSKQVELYDKDLVKLDAILLNDTDEYGTMVWGALSENYTICVGRYLTTSGSPRGHFQIIEQ